MTELKEGSIVRLKSGTEGWIKGQIVEYYDLIPGVGGMIYAGPGYKVHVLEGKHKGQTIRVPENYVEPTGHAKPGGEPLYPHVPKSRQPLFPHVPKGQQPVEKPPQTLPQTGTCYEDAWRFLIKEEEGELIHGTLFSGGRRMGHAWVETLTGWVWEPATGKFFAALGFKDAFAPVIEARYTAEEAAIMAARTKNLGPWTKQERLQYLGEAIGLSPQTKEKLYQRGPDGYPIGSDKIMRDAWGPIPDPDQPFWSGKGFVKPVMIYGWQWSPDYHSWRAYVRFPDGTETWTSPFQQTGGGLELLASTEGDPIRKFCCRQCDECAPKELLEEGRFLDRISWLRDHYKEKHPGMWGTRLPLTMIEDFEPVSPQYRHLVGLVSEPLPKEAD